MDDWRTGSKHSRLDLTFTSPSRRTPMNSVATSSRHKRPCSTRHGMCFELPLTRQVLRVPSGRSAWISRSPLGEGHPMNARQPEAQLEGALHRMDNLTAGLSSLREQLLNMP